MCSKVLVKACVEGQFVVMEALAEQGDVSTVVFAQEGIPVDLAVRILRVLLGIGDTRLIERKGETDAAQNVGSNAGPGLQHPKPVIRLL
jgi:hypothetical protein